VLAVDLAQPALAVWAYEPNLRATGLLLPHVDEFRPVHNLESLAGLMAALGAAPASADKRLAGWQTELAQRSRP